MSTEVILLMVLALITKHFICDFLLQGPFQYLNKGTYGHPGGLLHAQIQGIGSFFALVLFPVSIPAIAIVSFTEHAIHYHIDWAKMNLNLYYGLNPDNSEKFWWILGCDQWLHYLTYVGMVWYLTTV